MLPTKNPPALREADLIRAEWPAPAHVQAWVTTRAGGVSVAPFDALNLGLHVNDDAQLVMENRQRLSAFCQARGGHDLFWLNQVHGVSVASPECGQANAATNDCPAIDADASTTSELGRALVVMTADCLPVFFTDRVGSRVAVAHAGWRGLCAGVLEATVARFAEPSAVMAWLGPAIGPTSFEVGESVREAFINSDHLSAAMTDAAQVAAIEAAFAPTRPGHFLADLYRLARLRLANAGVTAVYGGGFDTFSESSRFFSYRREAITGRLASVIWLTK